MRIYSAGFLAAGLLLGALTFAVTASGSRDGGAARAAAATEATPPVTVVESDTGFRVGNGFVELTVDKKSGAISHLATPGGPEMLNSPYDGYADLNGSPGGEGRAGYDRLGPHTPVTAEIAQKTPEIADVVLRTDGIPTKGIPLGSELHYVVRRGVPGFYCCWLLWHDGAAPDVDLGQSRTVLRLSRAVFDRFRISDDRAGVFPTPDELKAGKTVYDATMQLADGTFRTKYANSAPISEQDVYGVYGTAAKTGLWLVKPSSEFMNGTPDRRELTIHEEAPLLLNMGQAGHYVNSQDSAIRGKWSKAYGPVLFYVNRGLEFDAAWADAKRRVAAERAEWPYAWAKLAAVPDAYPLQRGTVTGRIARADGGSAAGAWAVLSSPSPLDLQLQAIDTYEFWAKAGPDGRFTIPKVRPGDYALTVYQPGVFGEAKKEGIHVAAPGTVSAGTVTLSPVANGRLLWQIGTADRSAGEFRHGSQTRQVYLFHEYATDFPNDVHFTVGKSDPAVDWNYCQQGGHPWTVAFDLPAAPQRDAVLTLAVSDSGYGPSASVDVAVNGRPAGAAAFEGGANCLYRLGTTGRYQYRTVTVPAAALKAGRNELILALPQEKMWAMYDFVRLEEKAR